MKADAEEPTVSPDEIAQAPLVRFRRIVVPVSNPRTAPLFLSIARAMLDRDEGRILAVTVVTDDAQAESSADTLAAILDALDASFGPEHGIEVQRRDAPAVARGILDFVRDHNPDLVVMGMDVTADGQRFSAVSDAVVEAVHCAVLAVRPSEEPGIERVLVGIDGSDEASAALSLAALVADRMSVPLTAVHVRDPALSRTFAASVLAEAAATIPEWLDADGHVVEATHPAQGILARSRPTDLVFLGAPHRRGIGRLASGGTLDQALRREDAHLAVLVKGAKVTRTRRARFGSWFRSLRPALTPLERESVRWRAGATAPLTTDYMILLGVSALLASFGLLQDNVAVVIGAMLVAPLLGPLSAASTALVTAQLALLWRAVVTLVAGIAGMVATALAVGAVVPVAGPTEEMLARGSPTLVDLGVAMSAGVVGAYATARKDIPAALAGVAIAAALVPPMCTTGLAVGLGDRDLAVGSLLLFFVNTVSVIVVGAAILWWLGLRPVDHRRPRASWLAALTVAALSFVVVVIGLDAFQETRRASIAEDDVRALFPDSEVVEVETDGTDPVVVTAVVRTVGELGPGAVRAAERLLREDLDRDVELRIVEQRVVTGR
ncbi:MAG: DUF389 domain-containing protein [Acidimicrobiia bacterium]